MGTPYTLDVSDWPMVRLRLVDSMTPEQSAEYAQVVHDLLSRNATFAMLYDARAAGNVPRKQRRLATRSLRSRAVDVQRLCAGVAVLVDSRLTQAALTTLAWLRPPPCPVTYHVNVASALGWAGQRLHRAGVAVPERAMRHSLYLLTEGRQALGASASQR